MPRVSFKGNELLEVVVAGIKQEYGLEVPPEDVEFSAGSTAGDTDLSDLEASVNVSSGSSIVKLSARSETKPTKAARASAAKPQKRRKRRRRDADGKLVDFVEPPPMHALMNGQKSAPMTGATNGEVEEPAFVTAPPAAQ